MAKTILIVDDDRYTRNVLEAIFRQDRLFRSLRPTVVTASDGQEGFDAFCAHRPDVVVADLLMPRVDGFELCKRIRAHAGGDVPALFVVSGVYRDAAIAQRLRADFRAELYAKPYQVKDLVAAVARALGVDPASRRAQAARAAAPVPRSGSLVDTPLPRLLLDLLAERATGRLTIERGGVRKTVDLVMGHPVAASSNAREETLGHFLVRIGAIDDTQHRDALERAARTGSRLGEALVSSGVLDSVRLVELLAAQVRFKIARSLRWPDGTWSFEPDASAHAGGDPLDVEQIVLRGLMDTADRSAVSRQWAPHRLASLRLTARGRQLAPRFRRLLGSAFADAWADGTSLHALVRAGVPLADAELAVDALARAGLIEVEDAGDPTAEPGAVAVTLDSAESAPSLAALAEQTQSRRFAVADDEPSDEEVSGDDLYAALFGDGTEVTRLGSQPLAVVDDAVPEELVDEESGVVDVSDVDIGNAAPGAADVGRRSEHASARRKLVEEYLRVQGADHYTVLDVPRTADASTIAAAVVERKQRFSLEWYARFDLGRDYAKLEDLHRRYEAARETLLDDERRRRYDAELAGGDLGPSAPSVDAELAFKAGVAHLEAGDAAAAVARLEKAVAAAPTEPDYRATLGWARFVAGGRTDRSADAARRDLNAALEMDADHALAHEYKGRITAALGADDVEAIFHLERALDRDPRRIDALAPLAECRRRRGELRPLERTFRKLLHRMASLRLPELEARVWRQLAKLYIELGDTAHARTACESALRLAPADADAKAMLAALGGVDSDSERIRAARERWLARPDDAAAGHAWLRAAQDAGAWDAAYLAASALVARHQADDVATEMYRRFRPRFVIRAQRPVDASAWSLLAHPDDDRRIGELFDLLSPIYAAVAPLTPADLDLDDATAVADADLPPEFTRVRAYIAHALGVLEPAVHVRTDFDREVHVGAVDPPVLIVGDDVLAAPERLELAFRLGRAMTYLRPGRALGGSRPGTALKLGLLGALRSAAPSAVIPGDMDAHSAAFADQVAEAVHQMAARTRDRIHALVLDLVRGRRSINLSAWQRSLARTADRAGLLFCGDLPVAARFIADEGAVDRAAELVDYALSSEFSGLRGHLGLSIDV
ncbi:MAG: response regulator [Deltaproteobacteria bacterium]|nr:MAG: response regulator [Deltaproteobacteria bacterium]